MLVAIMDRRVKVERRTRARTTPDRRRGRPQHVPMTLEAFAQLDRNLTLRELSDLSSVPTDKLLTLIPEHLDAFMPSGFKQYFVTCAEATRFLRELRLIPSTT
jgi:hypothetical protein